MCKMGCKSTGFARKGKIELLSRPWQLAIKSDLHFTCFAGKTANSRLKFRFSCRGGHGASQKTGMKFSFRLLVSKLLNGILFDWSGIDCKKLTQCLKSTQSILNKENQ
jgi:hypothetical protein